MSGDVILYLLALVFSVVFHEVSHGWVADRNGDPTARVMGRLTLNPIPHIDLWGSILLPGMLAILHSPFLFGYAKPVPVDVRNLHNPRIDGIKVALAGPGSNLLLGLVCAALYGVSAVYLGQDHAISRLLVIGVRVNCILAVFNLIPVPPLDGSWLLDHTLRGEAYNIYRAIKPYGFFILLGILMIGPLSDILIGVPFGALFRGYLNVSQAVASWIQ